MSAEPPSVVVATLGGFFGTINRKDTWIRFAAPGVLSLCVAVNFLIDRFFLYGRIPRNRGFDNSGVHQNSADNSKFLIIRGIPRGSGKFTQSRNPHSISLQ